MQPAALELHSVSGGILSLTTCHSMKQASGVLIKIVKGKVILNPYSLFVGLGGVKHPGFYLKRFFLSQLYIGHLAPSLECQYPRHPVFDPLRRQLLSVVHPEPEYHRQPCLGM